MSITTTRSFRTLSPYARLIAMLVERHNPAARLDDEEYERLGKRHRASLEAAFDAIEQERDREIIQKRVGLDGDGKARTHEEVAAFFDGIGRERVRQREDKALAQVDATLAAAGINLATAARLRPKNTRNTPGTRAKAAAA